MFVLLFFTFLRRQKFLFLAGNMFKIIEITLMGYFTMI